MTNVYCIDFYPSEWVANTIDLTPEERGIYIQIVALIYAQGGPIRHDEAWLARACGCSTRALRPVLDRLKNQHHKIDIVDGKIFNNRAQEELAKKRARLASSSNGGVSKARNADERSRFEAGSSSVQARTDDEPGIETEGKDGENNDLGSSPPLPSPPLLFEEEDLSIQTLAPASRRKANDDLDEWFQNKFWTPYPKQRAGSKEQARRALKKALTKTTREEIENAVTRYAQCDDVARGFAKGAAAWLNDERWTDQPRPASGQRHDQKTGFLDKIATFEERGREILRNRMEAESGQPWNEPSHGDGDRLSLGRPEERGSISDGD